MNSEQTICGKRRHGVHPRRDGVRCLHEGGSTGGGASTIATRWHTPPPTEAGLSLSGSEEASFKPAINYLGDLSAEESNTVYGCLLSLAPPHGAMFDDGKQITAHAWPRKISPRQCTGGRWATISARGSSPTSRTS